jgi:hypothetical protein
MSDPVMKARCAAVEQGSGVRCQLEAWHALVVVEDAYQVFEDAYHYFHFRKTVYLEPPRSVIAPDLKLMQGVPTARPYTRNHLLVWKGYGAQQKQWLAIEGVGPRYAAFMAIAVPWCA